MMDGETIQAFQARAAQRLAAHDERITAPIRRDLDRARRSVAVLRLTLEDERRRAREAVAALEDLLADARHSGPCREHYTAIVALLRVKRALGTP